MFSPMNNYLYVSHLQENKFLNVNDFSDTFFSQKIFVKIKHFEKPFWPFHMGPSRVLKNNFLKSRYTVPLSSLARNRAPSLTPNLEIMYQNFKRKSSYPRRKTFWMSRGNVHFWFSNIY